MRNTENPVDFTPTFSVGGCSRACALPHVIGYTEPNARVCTYYYGPHSNTMYVHTVRVKKSEQK